MIERLTKCYNTTIEVLELNDLHSLGLKISILLLAFFEPMQHMLFSLLFLVAVDFVTGVTAALKRKNKITSSKLSRTISKILVYLTTVIVIHVANQYILFGSEHVPLENFVVGFIALTEVKSIFENLNRITKQEFLETIIKKLANDGRKAATDKKKR